MSGFGIARTSTMIYEAIARICRAGGEVRIRPTFATSPRDGYQAIATFAHGEVRGASRVSAADALIDMIERAPVDHLREVGLPPPRRIDVRTFGPKPEIDTEEWGPDVLDVHAIDSDRGRALYDALGVSERDEEYALCIHNDGRWALIGCFGCTVEGHRFAVEVES